MHVDRTHGRRSSASVTLDDVARRVGVSARTVSRVVNGEGGCTAETRERIQEAIDALGYRPNLMARGLIRRRSDTIGLIAAEMLDPFFPEFAEGVQRAVGVTGRTMFFASTNGDRVTQHQALSSMLGHAVDGAVVFPVRDSETDLLRFAADGLPIVVINTEIRGPGVASVSAEIQNGAELAVQHLLDRGRTRIALVIDATARLGTQPARREVGYRAALQRAGIDIDESLVIETGNSLEGGRRAAEVIGAMVDAPDAVLAYNDLMAIGLMQQLLADGVRVPHDIAIVGFDDVAMCAAMTPRLTSVRIDRDSLGLAAVDVLQQLQQNPTANFEPRRIPVELIVRDSS